MLLFLLKTTLIINANLNAQQIHFIFKTFNNVKVFVQAHQSSIINIKFLVLLFVQVRHLSVVIVALLVHKNAGNALG